MVFEVILLLFGSKKTDWGSGKALLGDIKGFMERLLNYDKNSMTKDLKNKLKAKVNAPEFNLENVRKGYAPLEGVAKFCLAMDKFGDVNENVQPTMKKVE